MEKNMLKYFYLIFCIVLLGCGYVEPKLNEPYGIIHPTGGVRITQIDELNTIDFTGRYIFRVSPGKHKITLAHGHNKKTPVKGTKHHLAKYVVDIKEGREYYIRAKLIYGLNNLFFGKGFQEVKAWLPEINRISPIVGYWANKKRYEKNKEEK